jgi:hypothetical protein
MHPLYDGNNPLVSVPFSNVAWKSSIKREHEMKVLKYVKL